MTEAPSLFNLCLDSIKNMILFGDEDISSLYQLPSEIIDCLIPRLPALALLKFEEALPQKYKIEHGVGSGNQRKRKRLEDFDTAWMTLYKSRLRGWLTKPENCSYCHANYDFENNWKGLFWNSHLQMCLDMAEMATDRPHFEGSLGEIRIPGSILSFLGFKEHESYSKVDYSKLAYQCQLFGIYARCLTLPNALLKEETSHLLRNCKLEALEFSYINSREQVEGLCKLLSQNVKTLVSLRFEHCQLSSEFVNEICDSLLVEDLPTHRIKHLRLSEADAVGLAYFLSSARCLCTADFSSNRLHQFSAKMIFDALSDASSNAAVLDLSDNNISGWLSHFKWKPSSQLHLNPGMCTLKSLRVLTLRGNNLQDHDADCLNDALFHMPNLEALDLSKNPIRDEGLMTLMPYFTWMAKRLTPFVDLNLEWCKLTCHGVISLLHVLSSFKEPLNSLRIGYNNLGSEMGVHLGKYICTGIKELDFYDIGIKSSGFVEAQEQITEGVKLVCINMSDNPGGLGAAKFISKLLVSAPGLVEIDASYNVMPAEAMAMIGSSVETAKGNLQHLDLRGNTMCGRPSSIAMLRKSVADKHIEIIWPDPPSSDSDLLYDSDSDSDSLGWPSP